MSGDIVERLRVDCECYDGDTCVHAAARDEIEQLRAEVERTRDYACRMDALAEERLWQATRLRAAGDALAEVSLGARPWITPLFAMEHGNRISAATDAWQEARRG